MLPYASSRMWSPASHAVLRVSAGDVCKLNSLELACTLRVTIKQHKPLDLLRHTLSVAVGHALHESVPRDLANGAWLCRKLQLARVPPARNASCKVLVGIRSFGPLELASMN